MAGSEVVNPEELLSLADRLGSTLGPLFDIAQEKFDETEVNGPAFSTYGVAVQAVYPTVQEFGRRDLQTKSQNVASIINRLADTAKKWQAAESASTITPGGKVPTE